MVAYLNRNVLTIVAGPCNGEAFMAGEKIVVGGKREARRICAERGVTLWNF
jgi:hypothetical protein